MDVAGVLQQAGDVDSRAHTISQVQVEHFLNCHTSRSIRMMIIIVLFVVIANNGKMGKVGVINLR